MAAPSTPPASPDVPECPICFFAYDNVFRSPLQLPPCAHTFCLQCLAQMCLFRKPLQSFYCPLCREPVPLPVGGAPCLPPNMEVVSRLPPGQRGGLQKVWLKGFQLHCSDPDSQGSGPRTLDLLPLFPDRPTSGPVAVQSAQGAAWCRMNMWCVVWTVLLLILCLFMVAFFPIYTSTWKGSGGAEEEEEEDSHPLNNGSSSL
ncbi:RING finger protein 223 isoform X1 [Amia ocellicauda]|uniref:RING finger protein 223 isoform X1 n=1 Tax=Amia ocellicauda TaxID=2972642 RepID=UPI003464346C